MSNEIKYEQCLSCGNSCDKELYIVEIYFFIKNQHISNKKI